MDAGTVSYEYDNLGQLIRVNEQRGDEPKTYIYTYDSGFNMTSEKVYAYTTEVEPSGEPEIQRAFTYDSIGNPVAVMYNNVEYYYVKNLQGDIIGLVDASGAWVVEYSYDAWGNILSVEGTLKDTLGQDNPLRYRGYFYDAETELYYLKSRYYSPEIGRFISADGQINHGMKGCNIYIYCNNNPVNYYDPSGRACICLTQRVFGNHVCDSQKNSPADDFGTFTTGLGLGVDIGTGMLEYSYRNASRPNNIGKGTFEKQINELLFGLDDISTKANKILEGLDYVGVAMEAAEGISKNIENGEMTPKIIWDATVDTVVLGANAYISIQSVAWATAVAGPYGLGASIVAGLFTAWGTDKIFSPLGDKLRGLLKQWVD